ncbi:MAG: hypothetical protein WBA88_27430 [Pseudaminobacter sp.]
MMTRAVDRWAAIRAAYENAGLDFERLAVLTGWSVRSIQRRAAREKWLTQEAAARRLDLKERLAKVTDRLIGQLEALDIGEEGKPFPPNKAHIDVILALMRALEKTGEIARGDDGAKENQTKRDADMAGALKRIDQRIVELAKGYARQLGRTKSEG